MPPPADTPAPKDIIRARGVWISFTSTASAFGATAVSGAGEAIPISRLVGLPLLAVGLDDAGEADGEGDRQSERQASRGAALFMTTDARHAQFGTVDIGRWGRGVVVCREDGRELAVQHVEGLCAYCAEDLRPAFEFSAEMGDGEVLREDVLGLISQERFAAFWEMYRAKQGGRDGWGDVRGPFDAAF